MKRFILTWLTVVTTLMPSFAMAGFPPTRAGGQSDTLSTAFDFRAPYSQTTKTSGTTALLETGNYQVLKNPAFEATTYNANWTASGGTVAAATTTNIFYSKGATWDSSAAAQTFLSDAITVPEGFKGNNCEASIYIKVPTGTATHLLQAWDGTNPLASQTVINSSTSFRQNRLNFPCPSSGTFAIRILSVAADEPLIALDEGYLGLARNVDSGPIVTEWASFTPTVTAISGALTNFTARGVWRQVGDTASYRFQIQFTGAVGTWSGPTIALPAGQVIDVNKIPGGNISNFSPYSWGRLQDVAPGDSYPLFARPTSTTGFVVQYPSVATHAGTAPVIPAAFTQAAPITMASGDFIEVAVFDVPIVGWASSTVVQPNAQGLSWSGTHANDCAWTTTSASLAAIGTGDATCTFATLSNRNFGSVVSATAASNNIPGIVFTPVVSGKYFVCATAHAYNASAVGNFAGLAIHDGTSIIASSSRRNGNGSSGTNDEIPFSMCGIATLSAGTARTVQLYANASAGTTTLTAGAAGAANVTWSIFNVDQPTQAILANSVSTTAINGEKIESLRIDATCSASPCTIASQSGGFTDVTRGGTGTYTVNYPSSTWSAAPRCVVSAGDANTLANCKINSTATTTNVQVFCPNTSTAAGIDSDFNLICMGPR